MVLATVPASGVRGATAAANGAIAIEYVQVEPTLDDHVSAVLESPAACRRIIRTIRERAENGEPTRGGAASKRSCSGCGRPTTPG